MRSSAQIVAPVRRSECIIPRLEGIGIVKSECPCCGQPGWKKDLRLHVLHQGVADFLRGLVPAESAAGGNASRCANYDCQIGETR